MFTQKFSLKDESDITRKLSMYLNASLSLSESLLLLEEEITKKKIKNIFSSWRMAIEEGKTLSLAFEQKDLYEVSSITKTAVNLGEKTASLAQSFKTAHLQLERILAVKKKIVSALAYPALILIGTTGLVLGLLIFVFPKIIPLFTSLNVSLPLSTRILIGFTTILQHHWLVVVGSVVLVGIVITVCYAYLTYFRNLCNFILIRLPFVGRIIKARILADIFNSLFILINGNESLDSSLLQISVITKHHEYADVLKKGSEIVAEGKSLAEFLTDQKKLFPTFIPGLVSVGERTGNVASTMNDIAVVLHSELDDKLKVLTAALEPILMISMSLLIGFIAISIILPIYGITSHFQNV